MLIADFSNSDSDTIMINGLFQWDYGQQLEIRGLNLPEAVQIHFSTKKDCGDALRIVGTTSDSITTVKIPDVLLAEQEFCNDRYTIWVFVYINDENSGETIKRIGIQVKSRPKPEDYTDPGTDDPFADTIEQVKQYADQAEQSAADAETARTGAEKAYHDTIEAVDQIKEDQISMAEKIAIKPTATGTDIVADNSADWRLLDLSAQGWTEQTVTDGNQLCDASEIVIGGLVGNKGDEFDTQNRIRTGYIRLIPESNHIISGLPTGFAIQNIFTFNRLKELSRASVTTSFTAEEGDFFLRMSIKKSDESDMTESDLELIKKSIMVNKGSEALPWESYSGGYPSPRPEIRTNQLFDASKLPTKSQGGATVTNNEDGSFTISGEGNLTETFSHGYDYTHSDLVNFFREGKLYLDVGVITTPYVYFNVKKQGQNLINANNELREKVEVTITKEILDDPETTFRIGFYGTQGSEITPQIIYPMLYQDGDGAWEPYGTVEAWPQPIVSAAEDAKTEEGEYPVTFSITGKNLINFYKYYNSFSGSDGYEGSANEINQIKINLPKSLIGKQVCFSAKIKLSGNLTESYVYAITGGIGKGGNIIRNKNVFEISKVIFTPKTEEDTIHITYGTNGTNTVYFKDLMLNLGEEAGFEPYKNPQTVTITSDRPLTKWDRMEKRDGKWGWSYRSENVVYDGSTDENWIANESAGTNAFSIFNGNTIYNTIFCNKLKRYVGAVSQIPYGSIQEVSLLIILKIENIASVDELRSWMAENPLNIWHEISNEEWVELPQEEQNALNALTTYYPTTVIQNNAGMEMTVKYVADPENYLRKNYQEKLEQIDTLAGQVATLQEYIIKEV